MKNTSFMKVAGLFYLIVALLGAQLTLASFNNSSDDANANWRRIKPTSKEILKKIRANYEELESLQVHMNYKLFKGYKSDSVTESYTSEFMRLKNQSYRKIKNTEFVANSEMTMKISHDQKIVVLTKPSEFLMFDYDLESMIKLCKDVIPDEQGKYTKISLVLREKTDVPLSRLDLIVDKKYFIHKLVFYYSTKVDFSQSYHHQDYEFPRLEVEYQNFKSKWSDKDQVLKTNKYLNPVSTAKNEQGSRFELKDSYAGYELIDLRNIE